MSNRPLYIILLVAGLIALGWLHWFVVPDMVVATLDPKAKLQEGLAFGTITQNLKFDSPVMIAAAARGWSGLFNWWPFAFASVMAGGLFGWFLGRLLQVDDFQAAAKADKDYAEQRLEQVERKRIEAEEAQAEAYRLNVQTAKYKRMAEQSKAETAAAQAAQAEAERKLLAERDRHKDEMAKAGARIKELKEKSKKNKALDEP